MKASGIVIDLFFFFRILAGNMIPKKRMILMILCKLIHEGLISAVGTGDALRTHDKYMLHGKNSCFLFFLKMEGICKAEPFLVFFGEI